MESRKKWQSRRTGGKATITSGFKSQKIWNDEEFETVPMDSRPTHPWLLSGERHCKIGSTPGHEKGPPPVSQTPLWKLRLDKGEHFAGHLDTILDWTLQMLSPTAHAPLTRTHACTHSVHKEEPVHIKAYSYIFCSICLSICGLVAEGSENSGKRNQSELDENIPDGTTSIKLSRHNVCFCYRHAHNVQETKITQTAEDSLFLNIK